MGEKTDSLPLLSSVVVGLGSGSENELGSDSSDSWSQG